MEEQLQEADLQKLLHLIFSFEIAAEYFADQLVLLNIPLLGEEVKDCIEAAKEIETWLPKYE